VTTLVPGDVVELAATWCRPICSRCRRTASSATSRCRRRARTGAKQVDPIESPESPLALPSCAFTGTVVRDGSGHGVVTQTGARTAFGAIAMRLGERQPDTSFQLGLQKYR
jgi:P-type Mg2+ transporter